MTHKILNRDPKDEILKAFRLFDDDDLSGFANCMLVFLAVTEVDS
jgi:Ca2+-binding EF-hand superfamily protein